MYNNLAVLAVFAFLFSVIAGRVERSIITGPMVYIFFGLLAGPVGVGILNMDVDTVELRVIADLTLALVLFIDASNADLRVLRKYSQIPVRMLLVGLPLCIALGAGVGTLVFPDISLFEVCVLATMLAATDAALGKGVVSNKAVPDRVRQGLNAESGLNDGMAVPVLFVFLALAAGSSSEADSGKLALQLVLEEIGIGIAVAVVMVTIAVQLMKVARDREWFNAIWHQIPVVALALSCFAIAQSLHGSGFIACFVGGLLFGYFAGGRTHDLVLAAEGIGELLAMFTWVVFGAVFMGPYLAEVTWPIAIYALLSLTVIRMVPVVIALTGTGEPFENKLFLAWFGPRGLASIVFMVIVTSYNLPAESVFIATVVLTITLCIVAHGLTANPWAARLARKSQQS